MNTSKLHLSNQYQSWGRYPIVLQKPIQFFSRFDTLPPDKNILACGMQRSYGDSCLNHQETIILTHNLDHFIAFDSKTGLMRCESGVTFAKILELVVPLGFFLPVTPGTKFISDGGAIANDVHGKNHHSSGNFGHHITQFELLRSDGNRLLCSPSQNSGIFNATIGGLGLTGLITWAEFQLIPIFSDLIYQESIKFSTLHDFFEISKESELKFPYTVSWIDCLAKGSGLGRGLFIRGDHIKEPHLKLSKQYPLKNPKWRVPFDAPNFVLGPRSISAFNSAYYRKQLKKTSYHTTHYNPFFYPLDSINNWNRLYGKRGFLQYQCVVPRHIEESAIREILATISSARMGSFLAVLKKFGDITSKGLLSFPRPGTTLALDFPNSSSNVFKLLNRLDDIVKSAGGAVYPAKDARMSQDAFSAFYPQLSKFKKYIDPQFSSSFWRRVGEP